MPKVTIVTLPFRKTHLIKPVFDAMLNQTHKDLEIIAVINDPQDGSKEIIQTNYPQVKILIPGWNSFFAAGNNLAFKQAQGEFIQLVNDDLILEPDCIEKMLPAFQDEKVAAATGKLLRYDFATNQKTNVIDSTGVVMAKSGRAKDRGQLEIDNGQYDNQKIVFGVSGAGCMYRKSYLEKFGGFDEDFFAYWEDVDLSWQFNNAGYKNVYVPEAVAYHGRTAGQSKGGYFHLWHYIQHHKKISPLIRQLNYRNHILMYLKNSKHIYPQFLIREFFMFFYVLVFETSTLKVLPELFRLIGKMRKKRALQIA